MKQYDDYNTIWDGDDRCEDSIEKSDLVLCPWCKNEPELIESEEHGFAYCCGNASNGDHYVETGWAPTEAEAAELWNRCGGAK